jgi:hypothetical protein
MSRAADLLASLGKRALFVHMRARADDGHLLVDAEGWRLRQRPGQSTLVSCQAVCYLAGNSQLLDLDPYIEVAQTRRKDQDQGLARAHDPAPASKGSR